PSNETNKIQSATVHHHVRYTHPFGPCSQPSVMPSQDELETAFKALANAVRGLDQVPIEKFAGRLHNKARRNDTAQALYSFIDIAPDYNPLQEEDSYSQELDGRDATNLIAQLTIASVGKGTSMVDESKDSQNYKSYIRTDNAEARYGEIVTVLTSLCFAEHIDVELKRLGQPSIKDLTLMDGFADYAIKTMSTRRWISQEISIDLWRGDHLFTISMLLLADFFKSDPTKIPAYNTRFRDQPSKKILQTWSYTIWDDNAKGDAAKTDTIVKFLGNAATIVFVPQSNGYIAKPTPTFEVMRKFYTSIIDSSSRDGEPDQYRDELQDSLSRLGDQEDAINEWKSYCESMASYYRVNMQPKWNTGVINIFDGQIWNKFYTWMNLTFAKEWDLYWDATWLKVIPDQPLFMEQGPIGCPLLLGTSILLSDGEPCPVERLTAIDRLHAGPVRSQKMGIPESSTYCIAHRAKVELVGFNGEAPFATPGQPFLTSTGLRAVNPKAALVTNPFLRIGKLAIGHVIYLRDGEGYKNIVIRSIEKTKAEEQQVYSIFLASSQKYYHANGYLVSQNVPEHTLQHAVEYVQQVPESQRLPLLSGFKELYSTFAHYDRETIKARLELEIQHGYLGSQINKKNVPGTPEAIIVDDISDAKLALPAQQRKKVVPLDQLQRRYELSAHDLTRMPKNYHLPSIDVIDGCMVVDDEVQLRSSHNHHDRTFKWTRKITNSETFEHGMLRVYQDGLSGHGTVFVTSESDPTRLSKDDIHTFDIQAKPVRGAQSPENVLSAGGGYVALDNYKLTVDRREWLPNTEQDDIQDPIDMGDFTYGYSDEGDKVNVPYVQFPTLNIIQEEINTKCEKDLDELYRIECATLADNTFRATVRFHRASTIPLISDSGDDIKTFDVRFPDLGLEATLPVLFQEFYIDIDIFEDFSYGAVYEFDPEMRGGKGTRHLISAEYIDSQDYFQQLRTKVSQAFAEVHGPSKQEMDSHVSSPCKITDELVLYKQPSLQLLLTFPTYREDAVHSTVQNLIQSMMYYHMDQDDRKKFTKRSKPTDLPSALADSLPAHLKAFFHDKYAPAFLCRSIESFDKYTSKFTSKERKRLWYWWEGNGDECLARSQEYNDLNSIASREAMKMLYSADLDLFLESTEGPDYWATELLGKLTAKRVMGSLLTNPIQNGGNAINRECMLMDVLAPSQDFADQWFEKIVAYAGEIGLDYPYIDEDSDVAGQWLHDCMHDLIVKVLLDDPTISKEVKDALLEDIEAFEKANNLDQTETAKNRAANIVAKQALFIAEAKNWFTAVGKGLSKALQGTRLYQWLGNAFDQISDKVSKHLPGTKFLKGLSTLCMAAFYIGQLATNIMGLINDWDLLEPDQRATVILETLKIVTDGMEYAIDSFKRFKDNQMTSAADQLDVETLNQSTYRALDESGQGLGNMSEDINGSGGFHDSVADHVGAGDQTPTRPSGKESWNEKVSDPASDLPPGGESAAREFSLSGSILKGLNIALGIGVAAAMTFTLVREWGNLTTAGKIINTLMVITQVLTVILDIASFVGEFVATAAFSVVLPIIGAVLAVVGIILMFVGLFVNLYKSDPPEDPVETYINDTGKPLLALFNDAPDPQLDYTISHTYVTPGEVTSIEITGQNNSGKEVSLTNTRISLLSGGDDTCLFAADDKIILVSDSDQGKDTENHTYVAPDETTDANLQPPSKLGTTSTYYQYDLRLAGPKKAGEDALQALVLKPAEKIRSVWKARINKKGPDSDNTSSKVSVVEFFQNDKSHVEFTLVRGLF
ncbi:hypothetical protein F5Y03DRAFT_409408, partial [Xylaria venustula]